MDFISVRQAAQDLGVDASRVRQLLSEGKLQGSRVGGRWVVVAKSVHDRKRVGPEPGRPLSARNAWGALAILSGYRPQDLSAPELSRLLARLRKLVANEDPVGRLQKMLSSRAEERRYRVHRSALESFLGEADLIRAGVSAAPHIGADYMAPGKAEVYVKPGELEELERKFFLVPDSHGGNLLVRVPSVGAWQFLVSASRVNSAKDAPAPVVAVDLLDLREDRAIFAAKSILGPILAQSREGWIVSA